MIYNETFVLENLFYEEPHFMDLVAEYHTCKLSPKLAVYLTINEVSAKLEVVSNKDLRHCGDNEEFGV